MNRTKCMCVRAFLSFRVCSNSNGRDNYYGIFSGVEYARLTTKKGNREVAKELEKILAERGQKKKITQFIKKLGKERVVSLYSAARSKGLFRLSVEKSCFLLPFAPSCPIPDKFFPILATFQLKNP